MTKRFIYLLMSVWFLLWGVPLTTSAQSSGDGYNPDNPAEPGDPAHLLDYDLTVSSNIAEAGTVSGSGTYAYGTDVVLKATVNTGYRFMYWTKDGSDEPYAITTTFSYKMGVANTGFTAVYEKAKSLTIKQNIGAAGTANATDLYSEGTTLSTYTAGTSTYSSIYPYIPGSKYSMMESVYTPAQVGGKGLITYIAYYLSTASSWNCDLKIYMGRKSASTFASTTDYVAEGDLTLVYDGSCTLGKTTGWEKIILQTPYDYDGTGNLVVVVLKKSTTTNSTVRYRYSSYSNTILYRSSSTDESYASLSNTSIASTRASYRPNTLFGFESAWTKENTTISTTVNTNYQFLHWLKDEETEPYSTETSFVYGFDNDDVTFTAVYQYVEPSYTPDNPAEPGTEAAKLASYSVEVGLNDAEAGVVSGVGKYKYGTNVTISTSPNAGWEFRKWLKGSADYSTDATFTYTIGTEDVSFTAVYEYVGIPEPPAPITHKLYLEAAEQGSCTFSIASGTDIEEDAAYSVTVMPGTDQEFLGWYINGTKVGSELTYNCSNMGTEDVTLKAVCKYNPGNPDDPTNSLGYDPGPQGILGDVNGDGKVNVSDAIDLIGFYLNNKTGELDANIADVDKNGTINVSDAIEIIDKYLNNK